MGNILNYSKFNESIRNLLVGPTDDEIWNSLKEMSPYHLLEKSCEIGLLKGVKYAVEHNADVNKYYGYSFRIAVKNKYEDIILFLLDNGVDINKALYFNVTKKQFTEADDLIKYGADLKELDPKKLLDDCMKGDKIYISRFLKNHGIK